MTPLGGIARILDHLDLTEATRLLRQLVEVPSPMGGEGPLADVVIDYLRTSGLTDIRRDANANFVVVLQGARPGPTRMFMSHLDQPAIAAPPDAWRASLESGAGFGKPGQVIRGPGVVAPKAALAAMLVAIRGAFAAGLPHAGAILFAGVTRDLAGNHDGPRELFEAFPMCLDWAVVGEASENRLVLGARGIVQSRVRLRGLPAHRGDPEARANPLFALADVLRAIEQQVLPYTEGLGSATIAPFEVASDAAAPRTPEHVDLLVDRRSLPGEVTSEIVDDLRQLVATSVRHRQGIATEVRLVRCMHSFALSADHPFVAAMRDRLRAALGCQTGTIHAPFASNAGYLLAEQGCPALGCGPGALADLGPDEHVEVAQLEQAVRMYAAMMTVAEPAGAAA
jgi:succinyl-diaminopimelate desuccinylase